MRGAGGRGPAAHTLCVSSVPCLTTRQVHATRLLRTSGQQQQNVSHAELVVSTEPVQLVLSHGQEALPEPVLERPSPDELGTLFLGLVPLG